MYYGRNAKKPLISLSALLSGHQFRQGIKNFPEGEIKIIQPSDIDGNGRLVNINLHRVGESEIKKDAIIENGDIIIKMRSNPPIVFKLDPFVKKCAITYHFYIIRADTQQIEPDYLLWYLSSIEGRKYFSEKAAGAAVPFIKVEDLKKMEVPLPPMKIQRIIKTLNELKRRELEIMQEITNERRLFFDHLFSDIIGKRRSYDK